MTHSVSSLILKMLVAVLQFYDILRYFLILLKNIKAFIKNSLKHINK